ncbi:MAG: hypothetical protein M0Z46_15750 [Actinomycetota bacterium]|nr:hypothetical protein [Actinomycetota bacterium]
MSARRRLTLSEGSERTGAQLGPGAIGALAVAALYAALASGAKPFTLPADAAVSIPSAVFAGALVLERLRPEAGPWRRIERARPDGGGTAVPWLIVIALLVGVELASYFHGGPRAAYPTLSSGLDALFRYRAAKAAGWFVWLTAGWYLVRR